MDKYGEIKEGLTPPESEESKTASEHDLSEHLTKRAADAAKAKLSSQERPTQG